VRLKRRTLPVIAVASSANRAKANLVMSSGVVEAMRAGSE
jgi:hypothetical protein